MLQCKVILFSSHVLGSKLVMGQRTSLFSLNHLVKTDKDDNIFLRQSQTTGACAGFPAKFVLTSDIILSLNNYKKPQATYPWRLVGATAFSRAKVYNKNRRAPTSLQDGIFTGERTATAFSRAKVYNKNRRAPGHMWAFTLSERVPEAFEIPPSDWPENYQRAGFQTLLELVR